jgi:hypothetical protein
VRELAFTRGSVEWPVTGAICCRVSIGVYSAAVTVDNAVFRAVDLDVHNSVRRALIAAMEASS